MSRKDTQKVAPLTDKTDTMADAIQKQNDRFEVDADAKTARALQMKLVATLKGTALLCGAAVVLFTSLRNQQHCSSDFLANSVTKGAWYSFFDLGIGVSMGSATMFLSTNLLLPPDMLPSTKVWVCTFLYAFVLLVLGGLRMTAGDDPDAYNPDGSTVVRMVVIFSVSVIMVLACRRAGFKNARKRVNDTQNVSAEVKRSYDFKRERKETWLITQLLLEFLIGFYLAMVFATRYFEPLQDYIVNKFDDGTITGMFMVRILQVTVITFFASGFFPLWRRRHNHLLSRMHDMYTPAELSDPSYTQGVEAGGGELPAQKKPALGRQDEVARERSIMAHNLILDVTQFVYTRGVMFKLNSVWLLVLILLKDIAFHFWHFGFKYTQEYTVFALKIFWPEGTDGSTPGANLSPFWRKVAWYANQFVAWTNVATNWQVGFECVIDYEKAVRGSSADASNLDGDSSQSHEIQPTDDENSNPGTGLKVRLRFANMACTVANLPEDLARVLAEAEGKEMSPELTVEANMPSSSKKSDAKLDSKGAKKQDITLSVQRPDSNTVMQAKTLGLLPVSNTERQLLSGITHAMQNHIFVRYQCRAAAKMFTAYIFLLCPLVGLNTGTQYLPGFPQDIYDATTGMVLPGLLFLLTDVIEWGILTKMFFKYGGNIHTMLRLYHKLLVGEGRSVLYLASAAFFYVGSYMFLCMWGYSRLAKLESHLHDVTKTLPASQSLTWAMVHNLCDADDPAHMPWL
jgi:hypothetical protein